jgi:hypothetical protein
MCPSPEIRTLCKVASDASSINWTQISLGPSLRVVISFQCARQKCLDTNFNSGLQLVVHRFNLAARYQAFGNVFS